MSAFKGNESRPSSPRYGILACCAAFGKELAETFGAVGLIIARSKLLAGKHGTAVSTCETLPMPSFVLKRNSPGRHYFLALGAFGGVFLFEAHNAVDVSVIRDDERFTPDRHFAGGAVETFVVPLPAFVLHFLHPWAKRLSTGITAGGEFVVVTLATKNALVLHGKRLLNQRVRALLASEAFLKKKSNT